MKKITCISNSTLVRHSVGSIQTNKTGQIASDFDWVYTVDRFKTIRHLNGLRPKKKSVLNACLHVNISGEASKPDIATNNTSGFIKALKFSKIFRGWGVMTLSAPNVSLATQRKLFVALRECLRSRTRICLELDTPLITCETFGHLLFLSTDLYNHLTPAHCYGKH